MVHAPSKGVCRDLLAGAALLCAAVLLLLYPEQSVQAARQGLSLCGRVIVPSLFPFFVLSSLVVELGLARYPGRALGRVMRPLFRVGGAGASALVLGLVGGYPVGARTAIALYESGQCSKAETQRLLAFCNNSGPAFILGVVGAGVFRSGRAGLLLYLIHAAASLCVGLLFRFYGGREESRAEFSPPPMHAARFPAAFTAAVQGAALSAVNICAFVTFFSVAVRLLFACGVMGVAARTAAALFSGFGVDLRLAQQLLTGLLEVSAGVTGLSAAGAGRLPMAAFLLGWAGLCVHCQVLSFLTESGLSAGTYLIGKALHGVLSALFTAATVRLFPVEVSAAGYLVRQAERLSEFDFRGALLLSSACAGAVWLFFSSACRVGEKKGGNRGQRGV